MDKIKRFSGPLCLVVIGLGILLLAGWDMHRAVASIQPEAWYQGTNLPMPDAFYGFAQCPDDPDSFYVVAGWQDWFVNRDEVWRYDADTNTWTELASYPENMGVPTVTCYQGYLYAAGGSPDTPGTSDHFYRYEIATNTWIQLSDLPRTQNGAALAAWEGYLYMIGGDDAPAVPLSPTTQVDRYDLQAGTWETDWGTPMPVATIADWLQAGQYVYFVGGFTSAFPINSDATLRYDLASDTWEVGPSYTSRRAMGALVITSQFLYAIGGDANGGSSSEETDLVERLDLSAWPIGSWLDISDPLTAPRAANAGFCSEAITGGEIWSVGGLDLADNPTTGIFYLPSERCYDWPPQVLAVNPAPNSHDAEVTTPISITYDMDIDPGTVDAGSFAVHARQTGWLTETLSVDGGMITLQPTAVLHAGELVQVTATTATLSLDGEAPVEPTVWQFTTAPWSGNGRYIEHQILPNADGRYATLGDLNGDGNLDAIGVSCDGVTRVYFNDGKGTFTEVQTLNHSSYCLIDVDLGDLDGDGDLDAFLTDYDLPGSNFILTNDGTGHFSDKVAFPSQNDGYTALGDLDGDGDLDLFIASGGFGPGTLRVWKNDGTGNFTLASDFDSAYEHTGIALGDLDNDGDLDSFTTGWYNTFNKVWLNDGTGAFNETQVITNTNTYYPLLGDLDGDGNLDVYLNNGTLEADFPGEVWLNDGIGHFTDSGQRLDTVSSAIPALGDLDADGDLDVYLSGNFTGAAPDEVWANDGTGTFTLSHTVDENYPGGFVSLGDLDSDGDLDAFVTSQYYASGYQVYLNSGWIPATSLSEPLAGYSVQCPEQPEIIYMVGGVTSTGTSNRLYKYDATIDEWQRLADMPLALRGSGVACYHGKIYVAGGLIDAMNRLFIYDIAGDSWTSGANLPNSTAGPNFGAWDGKLYLMGGSRLGGPPYTPIARVDVYDIATDTWTADGGTPMPTATAYVNGVQRGPYYFIVGGASGDYNNNVDKSQRYDMATDTWELGPTFTSQRGINAHSMNASSLFVQGGDVNGGGAFDPTDLVEDLDLEVWPGGAWNDLGDPLPQPSLVSAGACTEARSGGEIWAIGGADEQLIPFADVYYRPSGPCVSFGVDLADVEGGLGDAGTTVEYWLTITNTGVVTDYFTLDVSTTWDIGTPLGGPGPIGPGESMPIAIDVEIPTNTKPGDQGLTEITATSISNLDAIDTTSITTVVGLRDFDLQPIPPDSQEGHPGEVLTYTLQVSNIGDFKDSYNVVISSTWETTATLTIGPLLPGEDANLIVLVTIPKDAMHGDWDYALVTLNSQIKPSISHSIKLTSTAFWHRMLMPLAMKN